MGTLCSELVVCWVLVSGLAYDICGLSRFRIPFVLSAMWVCLTAPE